MITSAFAGVGSVAAQTTEEEAVEQVNDDIAEINEQLENVYVIVDGDVGDLPVDDLPEGPVDDEPTDDEPTDDKPTDDSGC